MFFLALSSAVQLSYSFMSPLAGGSEWVDKKGSVSQNGFILKLFCDLIRDVPNMFLSVFENNIYVFNGISILIIIGFWISVIWFFIKIFFREYRKKHMDRDIRNLGILFLFLCGQRIFFRISVYGVTDYDIFSDEFWNFYPIDLGYRYEIFGTFSVFLCFIILMKMIAEKNQYLGRAAIAIFIICVLMSDIRLQIKGLGTNSYSKDREYVSGMDSEICLIKDIEKKESIVVPIRPDSWFYTKNAKIYYIGTDIFGFGAEMISDEPVENGKINLYDRVNMDVDSGILQIFIRKQNLVDNSRYQVRLLNQGGNIMKEMEQDNTEYQRIASFSFEEAVYGVAGIQILNGRGEAVQIENGIYLVSSTQEELLKKKMYDVDSHFDFVSLLAAELEQPFIATQDILTSIQLCIGTFNRRNVGTLNVEIVNQDGSIVAGQEIDASALTDNRWKDVPFQNCRLTKGDTYMVRIYSKDFDQNNCVALYKETDVDEHLLHAKCNGIEQDYCLELKIYGEDDE